MCLSPLFTCLITYLFVILTSAAQRLLHLLKGPGQKQAFQGAAEGQPVLYRPAQVQLHGGAGGTLQKSTHLHQRTRGQTLPGQSPCRFLITSQNIKTQPKQKKTQTDKRKRLYPKQTL